MTGLKKRRRVLTSRRKKIVKTSEDNNQAAPRQDEVVVIKSTQSISAQTINLEGDTIDVDDNMGLQPDKIDSEKNRYPYCIVWTPIPFIT